MATLRDRIIGSGSVCRLSLRERTSFRGAKGDTQGKPSQYQIAVLLVGLTFCQAVGCATLSLPWEQQKFARASLQNPVVQVVCLWEQAEGRDPDGAPCRGFAGQILFLGNRGAAPVEIDGDVRIYVFDDVGTVEEQAKPINQFDFDAGSWRVHLAKTAVGPSYSVFVPYMRRGQHNAQCSLRLRLTPKQGAVIFSEACTLPLRGTNPTTEATIVSEPKPSQDALQEEVNAAMSRALQKTTTIPLKTTESGNLAIANPNPPAGPPPGPPTSDDRLSRMEQLLAEIVSQQATAPPNAIDQRRVVPVNYETVSPAVEQENAPPLRFKLNRTE